jgi:hypothetical protein
MTKFGCIGADTPKSAYRTPSCRLTTGTGFLEPAQLKVSPVFKLLHEQILKKRKREPFVKTIIWCVRKSLDLLQKMTLIPRKQLDFSQQISRDWLAMRFER